MKDEKPILSAKRCFGHLGGTLGNRLFTRLVELGWFEAEEGRATVYRVSEKGHKELGRLGVKT
jgi:hypothetical protein